MKTRPISAFKWYDLVNCINGIKTGHLAVHFNTVFGEWLKYIEIDFWFSQVKTYHSMDVNKEISMEYSYLVAILELTSSKFSRNTDKDQFFVFQH